MSYKIFIQGNGPNEWDEVKNPREINAILALNENPDWYRVNKPLLTKEELPTQEYWDDESHYKISFLVKWDGNFVMIRKSMENETGKVEGERQIRRISVTSKQIQLPLHEGATSGIKDVAKTDGNIYVFNMAPVQLLDDPI